jgi:hypothetical protein
MCPEKRKPHDTLFGTLAATADGLFTQQVADGRASRAIFAPQAAPVLESGFAEGGIPWPFAFAGHAP